MPSLSTYALSWLRASLQRRSVASPSPIHAWASCGSFASACSPLFPKHGAITGAVVFARRGARRGAPRHTARASTARTHGTIRCNAIEKSGVQRGRSHGPARGCSPLPAAAPPPRAVPRRCLGLRHTIHNTFLFILDSRRVLHPRCLGAKHMCHISNRDCWHTQKGERCYRLWVTGLAWTPAPRTMRWSRKGCQQVGRYYSSQAL